MADLTITAANVVSGSGSVVENGIAGATITAGQVVYKGADGKFGAADANSATAEVRSPYGIALNGAANNQPISVQKSGPINPGATVAVGTIYALSRNPGMICPVADIVTGDYVSTLGIATAATTLALQIQDSKVAKP